MKQLSLFIISFLLCTISLSAQSISAAKRYYRAKQYEKAKPTMRKYAKRYPHNGSYNYWYGVCCYKTGEKALAEKYLRIGASKKISTAYLYLGEYYMDEYRFDEAIENYTNYIESQKKKSEDITPYEKIIHKAKIAQRALKGVAKVTFIDSLSVDKKQFLSAYKISRETGQLYPFNQFFNTAQDSCNSTVYETELKNQLFYAQKTLLGGLDLFNRKRISEKWGKATPLSSLNTEADENYPFLLSDGITLYYASNGEESMGGYDIFATRYSSATESFLRQQNIGMPFNSTSNDYMYVIDEYMGIGWFATERYQPEGKVGIYSFIVKETMNYYNYEKDDLVEIRKAAMHPTLASPDNAEANTAHERLINMHNKRPVTTDNYSFTFIIDNNQTYHNLQDFRSKEAQQTFLQFQRQKDSFSRQKLKLKSLRTQYHFASKTQQKKLRKKLLQLEKQLVEEKATLKSLSNKIRKIEKSNH